MATVKELKATARPQSGKGAARAERRAGRVPGVIYGNNQPPVTISVDDTELRQRILAGRFLTTIYDIDLEGKKHRVIPRDFHLDPVRDFPLHVDFMRLGEGATIRVSVPLHIMNAETAPGIKRGGTVNIVTHSIDLECSVDNIPQYIEADVSSLEISHSLHLSDIKLPAGVKSLTREDVTLVTIVPPSGYAEEIKAAAAAAAAVRQRRRPVRLPRLAAGGGACGRCGCACGGCCGAPRPGAKARPAATRRSKLTRGDAASCDCLLGSAIPARNTPHNRHNIGFMAVDEIARRHGFAPWRRRFQGETAEGTLDRERVVLLKPTTFMNNSGRAVQEAANFFKLAAGEITVFQDELELPAAKVRVKVGGGIAGHNGLRSISSHIGNEYRRVRIGIGHPGIKELVHQPRAVGFCQERPPLGRGAVRGDGRQCRAAGDGQGFDVPEQGASGAAGQGIFRQGRRRRKVTLVIAGLDPAIHHLKKMDTRVKPAYDDHKSVQAQRLGARSGRYDGIQMRYRRIAQCRQVDAVQRADGNGGGAGGELSVLHHRAECRRGRGARSAARQTGGDREIRADHSDPADLRRYRGPGARRLARARASATSFSPPSARSTRSRMWCAALRIPTSPMSKARSRRSPISRPSRPN